MLKTQNIVKLATSNNESIAQAEMINITGDARCSPCCMYDNINRLYDYYLIYYYGCFNEQDDSKAFKEQDENKNFYLAVNVLVCNVTFS